jgi:hypothetical protein
VVGAVVGADVVVDGAVVVVVVGEVSGGSDELVGEADVVAVVAVVAVAGAVVAVPDAASVDEVVGSGVSSGAVVVELDVASSTGWMSSRAPKGADPRPGAAPPLRSSPESTSDEGGAAAPRVAARSRSASASASAAMTATRPK